MEKRYLAKRRRSRIQTFPLCQLLALSLCLADCEWKEKEITVKEGEAVRFLKKFKKVKICEDGKLKYKKIADTTYTLACNGEN